MYVYIMFKKYVEKYSEKYGVIFYLFVAPILLITCFIVFVIWA